MEQRDVTIVCYALFAYDIGMGIHLDAAARLAAASDRFVPRQRALPRYLVFKNEPLRLARRGQTLSTGSFETDGDAEIVVFDFGSMSVTYRFRIDGTLEDALALSAELDDSPVLFADSRRLIEELVRLITPSISRPLVADFAEDYVIFQVVDGGPNGGGPTALIASNRQLVAQILRAEKRALSPHEIDDALASRIGYEAGEEAVIDWNAALLFQRDVEDVRPVLEYVNVELLELRWLDNQLDQVLERSHDALAGRTAERGWRRTFPLAPDREIRAVAHLQMDAALLFEGVTNALKLVGDQYLARLYRLAAQRMRVPEWHANIQRKLQVAESIHEKLSDQAARRRLEVLEWIIIALIALSTVMMFV